MLDRIVYRDVGVITARKYRPVSRDWAKGERTLDMRTGMPRSVNEFRLWPALWLNLGESARGMSKKDSEGNSLNICLECKLGQLPLQFQLHQLFSRIWGARTDRIAQVML